MFKRIITTMLLCLCVFAQRAATQQVPVSVLLENVREPANYVAEFVKDTEIRPSYADELFKRAKRGIEAVNQALAAGVPGSRTVNITFEGEHYKKIEKPMTLAEIKMMCERIAALAGKAYYLGTADQAITNASVWPGYIADGTVEREEVQARTAVDSAKQCIAAIDEALANGVPDSTVIKAIDKKMSLAEGREMCVYVRDAAGKVVGKNQAAEDATYEPFRKLLSGDKLRLYNERLKSYKLYGAGGKVLRTPEDYRDSPLWCTTGVDRDGIVPVWSVDCWHFKGMVMVGSVTTRTGEGDEAPSSAFR